MNPVIFSDILHYHSKSDLKKFFIDLYWGIIASRYCVSFCFTKVNQPYAYICPHIPSLLTLPPTLPLPPLQVIAKHQGDLPVLCCCFPLAILHSVVYICLCYSHFAPASPSPPVSSNPFSMSTSLFLPCHQVHPYHN